MRALTAIGVGLLLSAAPAIRADDAGKLEGAYTFTSGEEGGKAVPADQLKDDALRITDDTIVLSDDGGKSLFVLKYTLDTSKKPWGIAMTMTGSPFGKGAKSRGILELEGDTLKICYAAEGGEAPSEFKTKDGSQQHLFILKRKSDQ